MEMHGAVRGDVFLCLFALLQKSGAERTRYLDSWDDVGLRRAEQARPRPQPEDPARPQLVSRLCRGWHGLGPDAARWRSSQVFSPTKAVDKVRALAELRKQDAESA